jgi:hypothetical protein
MKVERHPTSVVTHSLTPKGLTLGKLLSELYALG